MAVTQDDIFSFRLSIYDPAGYLYFDSVDTLPGSYDEQTAYYYTVDSRYYGNGYKLSLRVTDAEITAWLTAYTSAVAKVYAYDAIIARLGSELMIASTSTGSESTTFQTLDNILSFYEKLRDDAKASAGVSKTPRYVASKTITVGV